MNINTCKYFPNILYVCVFIYIYIIHIHSTHTHILCKQKLLFWMGLIAIHRLTALRLCIQ